MNLDDSWKGRTKRGSESKVEKQYFFKLMPTPMVLPFQSLVEESAEISKESYTSLTGT